MVQLIIAYWLFSLAIMTVQLELDAEFFDSCENYVIGHNRDLQEKFIKREISPMVYKESKLQIRKERRLCVVVNYIVAPVTAPLVFISMTLTTLNFL